jgi:DNA modification methylase
MARPARRNPPPVAHASQHPQIAAYLGGDEIYPLFLRGDARAVLRALPAECVDCCMTSPPYWGKRQYDSGGIGLEPTFEQFLEGLLAVLAEVHRVLKITGSLWLNIGDSYEHKHLLGIPWRLAIAMMDRHGWILRNSIIWNKVKGGPDNTRDKLRNVHENVFHFVKQRQGYYYDVDAIRTPPKQGRVVDGAVISATGVRGIKYRRQLELSTVLSEAEKRAAQLALDATLREVEVGKLADFRMIIRGQQRTTHSDAQTVSGRARELRDRGFYFLRYHPKGSKPSDVWDILPEDTQRRQYHFAPYPEDLCRIPITATCPPKGIVLDPFCGTGTTMLVAHRMGRRSIGIDLSTEYLALARERCRAPS